MKPCSEIMFHACVVLHGGAILILGGAKNYCGVRGPYLVPPGAPIWYIRVPQFGIPGCPNLVSPGAPILLRMASKIVLIVVKKRGVAGTPF